jgi:hypothetical protein
LAFTSYFGIPGVAAIITASRRSLPRDLGRTVSQGDDAARHDRQRQRLGGKVGR